MKRYQGSISQEAVACALCDTPIEIGDRVYFIDGLSPAYCCGGCCAAAGQKPHGRFGVDTTDLFGDARTDRQRQDAVIIQNRVKEIPGGQADTSDLPIFNQDIEQLDLFS